MEDELRTTQDKSMFGLPKMKSGQRRARHSHFVAPTWEVAAAGCLQRRVLCITVEDQRESMSGPDLTRNRR